MLLIGAGLLIRSFWRLQQVSPGFNADGVLTLELTMTGPRYADSDRVLATYHDLWSRLTAIPGAKSAGGVSMLPLSQMFAWGPIVLEGRALPSGESFVNVDQRVVGGQYFDAMQIPLLKGRLFTERDTKDAPRVVVIDDHMAQVLWPNEDPLGKRLRRGGMDASEDAPWLTVVGIVGRIKQYTLDERDSRIAMYHPHTQVPSRAMNVVIRGAGDPAGLTAEAARQIRAVAPDLPLYNVRTMAQRVGESLARRRFAMVLLAVFAALALGLASIGIYGVMACLVSQGSRDIGIRIALGATPHDMLLMVVRHGAIVAAIGTILGLAGAIVVTRTLEHLLFDVTPTDGDVRGRRGAPDRRHADRQLRAGATSGEDRSRRVAQERINLKLLPRTSRYCVAPCSGITTVVGCRAARHAYGPLVRGEAVLEHADALLARGQITNRQRRRSATDPVHHNPRAFRLGDHDELGNQSRRGGRFGSRLRRLGREPPSLCRRRVGPQRPPSASRPLATAVAGGSARRRCRHVCSPSQTGAASFGRTTPRCR